MRSHDQAGTIAMSVLAHHLNADATVGKGLGNAGERSRLVRDHEIDVVAGQGLIDGQHGQLHISTLSPASGASQSIARGHHDIAEHSRSRRRSPRSAAVEHQFTSSLGLDEHGVEGIAHACQGVLARHHRGVHANDDASIVINTLGDSQQLDDAP